MSRGEVVKIRNIRRESEVAFEDESGSEFVRWPELKEEMKEAGFPSNAVVVKIEENGNFSFETKTMRFRCKIHAIQSDPYSYSFIGCFVRYSNGPTAKVTTIPLHEGFVRSISTNIRVEESYREIAKRIVRHFEEYSSASELVQYRYLLKRNFNWISREVRYRIKSIIWTIILLSLGFLANSDIWNGKLF